MRIAEFSDTFLPIVDGVGRVVYAYANHLSAMGHEVYVVAPMADTGFRGGYPFELVDYNSHDLHAASQYRTGVPMADRHYDRRMEMLDFDIIHAHSPFVGMEAVRVGHKKNIPVIGTFHSKYYDDFYKATGNEMIAKAGVKFVVEFYEHCDEVWAVSRSSAEVLNDYGYRGDIKIMPNGTEIRKPSEQYGRLANETFALQDAENVLLFVGQMDWKKNIARTLEATAQCIKNGLSLKLVLAGQGPDLEAIKEKVSKLGIAEHVIFAGHITDIKLLDSLYERADLFVFPSLYDNAPMVVREAAAMHTPAIVVKESSSAEIISHGYNGLCCSDTTESLSKVIAEFITDKEKLVKMGQKASITIPVSWDDIMTEAVKRYENLANLRKISQ